MKTTVKVLIAIIIAMKICNAQTNSPGNDFWQLGGNDPIPPHPVSGAISGSGLPNNFLGTMTGNTTPMNIGTSGRARIYIDNFTGTGRGCVGIGTPMFSTFQRPVSYLHIQQDNNNGSWGGGFRNWMSPSAIGTYSGGTSMMISNGDNIWLGLKKC